MSLLKTGVYANATAPLFALAGSGGGSTSSLQSPVSVVADVALGNADLTLTAQGAGLATLSVSSPGEATVAVNGAQSLITMGGGQPPLSLLNAGDGILRIQNGPNQSSPNTASFDVVGNVINLGKPGSPGSVLVNAPITLTAPSKATFTATTVSSTGGSWVVGDNSIALGGFARGMYVIYGDTGAATSPIDLSCRPNSLFVIDPANTVSGGGGGADTNWNMSPNGTGGLTLTLTDAPSSAFSMKVMPLYLF